MPRSLHQLPCQVEVEHRLTWAGAATTHVVSSARVLAASTAATMAPSSAVVLAAKYRANSSWWFIVLASHSSPMVTSAHVPYNKDNSDIRVLGA